MALHCEHTEVTSGNGTGVYRVQSLDDSWLAVSYSSTHQLLYFSTAGYTVIISIFAGCLLYLGVPNLSKKEKERTCYSDQLHKMCPERCLRRREYKPKTFTKNWEVSKKVPKRMASLLEMKEIFRNADAVCFDVDSTVIREEGIDELAKFCGVGDAVAEMTRRAMGGTVTFKAALTARLGLIRPSYEQVQKLISDNPPQLTPGIRELVNRLHQRGVQVFLVSGGFQSIVEHVALQLNIPTANVFANRLKFYFNGEYAGFDETQPTAESGGKGKVITHLKEQFHFKKVVMIGDGATDMEACPPGDCFIGFGGNVIRKQVKEKAKWYITHFDELLKELEER